MTVNVVIQGPQNILSTELPSKDVKQRIQGLSEQIKNVIFQENDPEFESEITEHFAILEQLKILTEDTHKKFSNWIHLCSDKTKE